MADSPPPAAGSPPLASSPPQAVVSAAAAGANSPKQSPTSSTTMALAPASQTTPHQGRALFSTELGTRPKRDLVGPPFPPMIVRSDNIQGVVDAARYWQGKYSRYCMGIFPDSGWVIEDFWDAHDIHIDGRNHYQEVLRFISQDNFLSARQFAEQWSRAYPDRVAKFFGVSDMTGIYDPADPLAIVDKVFVNGELKDVPRSFLWHVAHIMRTTMHEMRKGEAVAKTPGQPLLSPTVGEQDPASHDVSATRSSIPECLEEEDRPLCKSKKNRKKSRSRPRKLIEATELSTPSPAVRSVPSLPPTASEQHDRPIPPDQTPLLAQPSVAAHYGQAAGPTADGLIMSTSSTMVPSVDGPHPSQQKRKARNFSSGNYPHSQPLQPRLENATQGRPVPYSSRPPSGTMSNMYPVQGMNGQYYTPLNPMQKSAHGTPVMSPSMQVTQIHYQGMQHPGLQHPGMQHPGMQHPGLQHPGLQHSGLQHSGMMPPQPQYAMNPNMVPAFAQQYPNGPYSRGMPMEEMANGGYHANGHHVEQFRAGNRRSSYYSNNTLYDPYNGTNPSFNDHNTGRKHSRNSFADQPGRPRKGSTPGNRPQFNNHGYDRPQNGSANNARLPSYGQRRQSMQDDPMITADAIGGCALNWIGPDNNTVNELFLGGIPEEVTEQDIKTVIQLSTKIQPARVNIKTSFRNGRLNAHVLFSSGNDAKAVLDICNRSDLLVLGQKTQVTVPFRFFQKQNEPSDRPEYQKPNPKHPVNHGNSEAEHQHSQQKGHTTTDMETLAAKAVYSPQDARSDLQKKGLKTPASSGQISTGSPVAHASKLQTSSPRETGIDKPNTSMEARAQAMKSPVIKSAETIYKSCDDTAGDKSDQAEGSESAVNTDAEILSANSATETAATPDHPVSRLFKDLEKVIDVPVNVDTPHPVMEEGFKGNSEGSATPSGAPISGSVNNQSHESLCDDGTTPVVKMPNDDKRHPTSDNQVSAANDCTNTTDDNTPSVNTESKGDFRRKDKAGADTDADTSVASASEVMVISKLHADHGSEPEASDQGIKDHKGVEQPLQQPGSSSSSEPVKGDSQSQVSSISTSSSKQPSSSVVDKSAALGIAPLTDLSTVTATVSDTPKETSADAVKKSGPPQTPSLNPFAKPNKAKRLKEKEQKKREKKKEQEEKAVKAKARKSISPTRSDLSTSMQGHSELQPTAESSHTAATQGNTPNSTPKTTQEEVQISRKAKGKGKGKGKVTSAEDTKSKDDSKAQENDPVAGKQAAGKTKIILDKTGSVTEKVKAPATKAEIKEVSSVASQPVSRVQSPKPSSVGMDTDPVAAQSSRDQGKTDNKSTNKKSKKSLSAVAINLVPVPSPSRSETIQVQESEGSTPITPVVARPPIPSGPSQVTSGPASEADATSIMSSTSTLHDETTVVASPSPTTENFYAPLPTPSLPEARQEPDPRDAVLPTDVVEEQAPRTKKKKPKKKKKPVVATGSDGHLPVAGPSIVAQTPAAAATPTPKQLPEGERPYHPAPFGEQMTHIDSIRAAAKDPKTSYNQTNKRMAEKEAKKDTVNVSKEKNNAKNNTETAPGDASDSSEGVDGVEQAEHWKHIQAFLAENPDAMQASAMSSSSEQEHANQHAP